MVKVIMDKKNKKFKELAIARVNKALTHIQLIGNLSNKQHYSYEDKDIKKIFSAIDNEVKIMKQKFSSGNGKNKDKFNF
tara:strand:+ start:1046 stop:1282 length:237 start_codon:yes stop_codon:yes gene_type:complete